jgi:hypothetical protein
MRYGRAAALRCSTQHGPFASCGAARNVGRSMLVASCGAACNTSRCIRRRSTRPATREAYAAHTAHGPLQRTAGAGRRRTTHTFRVASHAATGPRGYGQRTHGPQRARDGRPPIPPSAKRMREFPGFHRLKQRPAISSAGVGPERSTASVLGTSPIAGPDPRRRQPTAMSVRQSRRRSPFAISVGHFRRDACRASRRLSRWRAPPRVGRSGRGAADGTPPKLRDYPLHINRLGLAGPVPNTADRTIERPIAVRMRFCRLGRLFGRTTAIAARLPGRERRIV